MWFPVWVAPANVKEFLQGFIAGKDVGYLATSRDLSYRGWCQFSVDMSRVYIDVNFNGGCSKLFLTGTENLSYREMERKYGHIQITLTEDERRQLRRQAHSEI